MTENSKPTLPIVAENSQLQISFKLSLADGTLVEEASKQEPMVFTLGDGSFVRNLEEMLIGLEEGTTAKLTLSPERAFGMPDSANYQAMPKSDFPAEMQFEEGHVIGFSTPTGEEIPGTVFEIKADEIVIDFNHPLAGATVVFEVTIEKVLNP